MSLIARREEKTPFVSPLRNDERKERGKGGRKGRTANDPFWKKKSLLGGFGNFCCTGYLYVGADGSFFLAPVNQGTGRPLI